MSSILFQNASRTVTLIDVPRSIAESQGVDAAADDEPTSFLYSSAPPETPYVVSNEPKTALAKERTQKDSTADVGLERQIHGLIEDALREIRAAHGQPWCLPRPYLVPSGRKGAGKRKADQIDDTSIDDEDLFIHGSEGLRWSEPSLYSSISRGHRLGNAVRAKKGIIRLGRSKKQASRPLIEIIERVVVNPTAETVELHIDSPEPSPPCYLIPPASTFLLADLGAIDTFDHARLRLLPEPSPSAAPGQFDFVLLDPPWPNASAKRARAYSRSRSLSDIHDLLASLPLERWLAPRGVVAVWITNKTPFRHLLLGDDQGGSDHEPLFDRWGVELVEEWLWIKTTVGGEPVTALDSAWRKPYEVLLLGRPRPDIDDRAESTGCSAVRRRVLAAVPDLHSRKPSLKALMRPLMPSDNYRALELFARNLTAGWWSWGDEVLNFNWQGHWSLSGRQAAEPVAL